MNWAESHLEPQGKESVDSWEIEPQNGSLRHQGPCRPEPGPARRLEPESEGQRRKQETREVRRRSSSNY